MYDISLPDIQIFHIIVIIKTAWQILYFALRNPFKTYAKLTQFTTVNLHILFIYFHTLKLVENKIQPLHWLLCLHVILLYFNVNFIVWMCMSYTYLLIVTYRVKTFYNKWNKLYITWINSLFIYPTEQSGFTYAVA